MTPPRSRFTDEELAALAQLLAKSLEGNGIGKQLAEIRETLLLLKERSENDHALVSDHQEVLYGSKGSQGIIDQTRDLNRQANRADRIVGIIVGALITTAISAFIYLVVLHPEAIK